MRHRLFFASCLGLTTSLLTGAFACGTRTGLPILDDIESTPVTPATDAGADRSVRPPPPPPPDEEDAALPPFDALPPIDARPRDASIKNNCPDASATLVYVVTSQNELYSFYPPDLTFHFIGNLACPAGAATPFSMTVNRKGIAYVVFTDGHLFRVSTATAACTSTSFVVGQRGFTTFGMGYVADSNDEGETLFVAQNDFASTSNRNSQGLGAIDTTSFKLRFVGPFVPAIPAPELTGTGDGRLFAWTPDRAPSVSGSHLLEVDKATGRILGSNPLAAGSPSDAFAFAFWGGDFYIFTSPGGASTVTKFSLTDGTEKRVASLPSSIVGAGVSTCAPE
jgi:hypothetical protein